MNSSPRVIKTITAALLCSLVVGCGAIDERSNATRAIGGLLDLRKYDFADYGPIELSGEWEFAWSLLVDPVTISDNGFANETTIIEVPGSWNGYNLHDSPLPGQGYATYRLLVLLPDTQSELALKILDMATASEIFINT